MFNLCELAGWLIEGPLVGTTHKRVIRSVAYALAWLFMLYVQLAVIDKVDEGSSVFHIQLFKHVIAVHFHSLDRNVEGIRNLLGRMTFFNKGDDLNFSL